jgi:hypothetical protein
MKESNILITIRFTNFFLGLGHILISNKILEGINEGVSIIQNSLNIYLEK